MLHLNVSLPFLLDYNVLCNPQCFYIDDFIPCAAAMKCPKNSFYEICSTSCPANCKDLAPPKGCKEQCEEGCTCKEGFIQSGKACVPFEQCGCIHNDLYYNFREIFFPSGDCKEKCRCHRGGEVKLYVCVRFLCQSCIPVELMTFGDMEISRDQVEENLESLRHGDPEKQEGWLQEDRIHVRMGEVQVEW